LINLRCIDKPTTPQHKIQTKGLNNIMFNPLNEQMSFI